MTTEQFAIELDRHDWYYMMSDSDRSYTWGLNNERRLKQIAAESEELQSMYIAKMKQHFPNANGDTEFKQVN